MRSDAFFRGVMGPVGSGKSVGCEVEIFRRALQQKPGPTGVRRSRWGIVRNTAPQLKTTSIKTWLDWFPEEVFGKFNWSPPYTHRIRFGDVDLEVIFLALDRDDDVRKLLSFEFTGIFINEAREIGKPILDACTMRVGRFPSMKDGGPSWFGVIADTNSPAPDHWWPIMAGMAPPPEGMHPEDAALLRKPEGWEFYVQPAAMIEHRDESGMSSYEPNPEAENTQNLTPSYYPRIVTGKKRAWVNVYVLNRLDEVFEGDPVYPEFRKEVHVAHERLEPLPGFPVYVGIDFGLTPAATFGQHVHGRDLVLRELVATNMGTNRFAPRLLEFAAREFPGFELVFTGDPAGDARVQTDEQTPFDILRKYGINARKAQTNDPLIRQGAVEDALMRMVDGKPAYLVSPCCSILVRGFEGGYHIDRYSKPTKDRYSHVHDAEQYRMLGRGAGRGVIRSSAAPSPGNARTSFAPTVISSVSKSPRLGWKPAGLR
jgi:hypothetical protein